MLKALFLDMDETLCDTTGANIVAKKLMAEELNRQFEGRVPGDEFADTYLVGIYREWRNDEKARYMPIIEASGEEAFRIQFLTDLIVRYGENTNAEYALSLHKRFEKDRLDHFHFYPGIDDFLIEARSLFTLVVITNGPEFSQQPKLDAVNMTQFVDHILIGGQEPEQKPARSIFEKALRLAGCDAHEAIHVGDSLAADIAGAHNSGITSVWIQHQQPLDAELGINPSHTVLHPSEIPSVIQKLHNS